MDRDKIAIRFVRGHWWSTWIYPQFIVTRFYDGSFTISRPVRELAESAKQLGYGDDVYWYIVERDLCSNILAEWIDTSPSAIVWHLAHGTLDTAQPNVQHDRERTVAAQAALNGLDYALEQLAPFATGDLPTSALLSRLSSQVRPHNIAHTSDWAASAEAPNIVPLIFSE
jgi:hypothetical protein